MRLVFAGTPAFAVPTLQALLQSEHQVVAVYTQPDRPAGRGRKTQASPIKSVAVTHGISLEQPTTLKTAAAAARLSDYAPDAMIVVAYGLLLPPPILAIPRYGCINVHASLLPRWRGAAPIQRAIEAGDAQTGITIMQMEAGLDTGPILARSEIPIAHDETAASLHDRLAPLGATLLLETLQRIPQGLSARIQDAERATYAAKLTKEEGELDWRLPAATLARKIRAFDPWPGAFTYLDQEILRVWQADVAHGAAQPPGTIVAVNNDAIDVATGSGVLRIRAVQRAGGKRQGVREFLNGHRLVSGNSLGIAHA